MSNEYQCRTKVVNGITYRVRLYDADRLAMRTSYQSREEAQDWIDRMHKIAPKYRGEITEEPWTKTVCIECGQESIDY